jgi:hypothetical protein
VTSRTLIVSILTTRLLTQVGDHLGSPNEDAGARGGFFGRSAKSPGLDDIISPVPGDQAYGARPTRPGGGVKRTKSLMQKIKSMVRRESEGMPAVPALANSHPRSQSMSAAPDPRRPSLGGTWRDAPVLEEEDETQERLAPASAGYPAAALTSDSRGTPVPVAGRY